MGNLRGTWSHPGIEHGERNLQTVGYLVAVVARPETSAEMRSLTAAELARLADVEDIPPPTHGALVLEAGTRSPRAAGERLRRSARRILGRSPWVGVSTGVTIQQGVERAREAIDIARRVVREPRVVLHEDTIVFSALNADRALCRKLAAIVAPLEGTGRRRDLMRTVETYLASRSAAEAARTLRIHRHTVDERVRRAEKILGRSLKESPDRFIVEAAFYARRLAS